jgi:hypothetical protein
MDYHFGSCLIKTRIVTRHMKQRILNEPHMLVDKYATEVSFKISYTPV